MLKAPVWKVYIPAYYFAGGAAGAALAMGAAAQFKGSPELKDLIRRAHWVGNRWVFHRGRVVDPRPGASRAFPPHVACLPSYIADEHGRVDTGGCARCRGNRGPVCPIPDFMALCRGSSRIHLRPAGPGSRDLHRCARRQYRGAESGRNRAMFCRCSSALPAFQPLVRSSACSTTTAMLVPSSATMRLPGRPANWPLPMPWSARHQRWSGWACRP